jgi:hypothetical protein
MPTNNPTIGKELQFKPTKPLDSGLYTDPGFTFDLIDETQFLSNKNPTNVNVNTLYSTVSSTDIISQFTLKTNIIVDGVPVYAAGIYEPINLANLKLHNPTSPNVNPLYSTVTSEVITSQFTLKTDTYATGIYEQKDVTKLLIKNPTNPDSAVSNTFKGLTEAGKIQTQFWPKYFGTGVDSLDMELKNLSNNLTNNLILKSNALSFISNIGNLPKNSSNASNIIIDREMNPNSKWAAAASLVGINLNGTGTSQYSTLNLSQLNNKNNPAGLADFRARKRTRVSERLFDIDFDKIKPSSTSTLLLKHGESSDQRNGNYYVEYSYDKAGVYKFFNLNDTYGFGEQGAPGRSIRQDFTRISNIHLSDGEDEYIFRGDKVTAIQAIRSGSFNEVTDPDKLPTDLIKFFFTGPKVTTTGGHDNIMVFRAIITSLTDSHNPNWTAQQMVGRADPNYHYTGYSRELSLDFTVYASDRDEMKPIWQKLNMLAGYTAPAYKADSPAPIGPWMRITIGDLFIQQPAVINSLSYTLHDSDTTWEINIERDSWMNQLPHKVSVSIGFNLITDHLPRNMGRFYTLNENDSNYDWLLGSTL